MMHSPKAVLVFAICFSATVACKSEKHETEAVAPAASSASTLAPPATQVAAAGTGACPAGRWKYDYSDQALEATMKSAAGAKVVKEEGEFVCDIGAGRTGTLTCATQGKPVVNVVETKQAGLPMTVSMTIDGKATTKFELLDPNRMKVVASDTKDLKVTASIKLGGKEVPFPSEKLLTMFGAPESTLGYKCEGGKLFLKPEVANANNVWQELTPVP